MARKVYVPVYTLVQTDGKIKPIKFKWEDGHWYRIDRILSVCNAASTKVGGCGVRYEIQAENTVSYLFDDDGIWFMEAENRSGAVCSD